MLKNSVNKSADPCEDFHEFACGKWMANNKIPDDQPSYSQFTKLQEKMYHSCMDVQSLNVVKSAEILEKISQFGHWPIIHGKLGGEGEWDANSFDLTQLFISIKQSRDIGIFFDVDVSRRLLHFDQGNLGLDIGKRSSRDYYLNETRYAKQLEAYEKYMNSKIRLFARDAGSQKTDQEIAEGVEAILDFEKKFAKILVPNEERRNYTKMYNVRRFSQLPEIFGELDWQKYFVALMPEDMHFYLDTDPEIVISDIKFFHYASGAMYVRKYFNKEDRSTASAMVEDLRQSFMDLLSENDWMLEETMMYALHKANEMLSLIGFPDFIYNDTQLDEYYDDLLLDPNDSYSTMVEESSLWALEKDFRRLIEEVDREEFSPSSAFVNAFYTPEKNSIAFTAAILQPPFFDRSFPKAVNYGAIGSVMGHEITHGFDDEGSQFDRVGNLKNWWDENTLKQFLKRTKCIIDQYSQYEVPGTGLKINGILTQGENIADNGGVKQAFNIWCAVTKPEAAVNQVLTDPHSPKKFRVNGVLVNQPAFAEAFNCPVGSKMNLKPEERCSVW
ncbi:peptidase family m13 domain-containing protein [Ditylenchus destructor]|uniref:Peptidase family m13 domain-containing protein n=1 Tax=Ditylenchus destructor TaxID=166010 RepID=A0AAD4ML07_9BILA|nr:peptidase family m13 domain-containing protein [Ditylenchus destructor]